MDAQSSGPLLFLDLFLQTAPTQFGDPVLTDILQVSQVHTILPLHLPSA